MHKHSWAVGILFAFFSACTGSDNSSPPLLNPPTGSGHNVPLTVQTNGNGTVASTPAGITCGTDCSANFTSGTSVTLTPTALGDSTFSGWTGACSGTGACVILMNAAQTVSATFTAGPPVPVADLTMFGSGQGLTGTVIDAGPDDAQNIWAVTPDALYVLRAGQTDFVRFTAADGLRIQPFIDPNGSPAVSNITAIAAGRAGEVFVGYQGFEGVIPPPAPPNCCVPNADFSDPRWSLGQADKITLNQNGTIQTRQYKFICDISFNCWEERSVRRMLFVHTGTAAGHLFVGNDHGVTHIFNDIFGDHIHVIALYHDPASPQPIQKQGEQYGLFATASGDLLTGSAYGVGLQKWNPDPRAWVNEPFRWAFTIYGPAEPYNAGAHSLDVPVGYREDQRGVAMTPDGTAWFASFTQGLASYTFNQIKTYTNVPGLPTSGLVDLAADPDGTLWIVDINGRLLRFDPGNLSVRVWPDISQARRIVMDTTVVPRALYVSMGGNGLGVIRAK